MPHLSRSSPLRSSVVFVLLLSAPVTAATGGPGLDETWRYTTGDGVEIVADSHRPEGSAASPLVVLLHMAGADGRGEYAPIVPVLWGLGYSTLQVDLRAGGDRFGSENRTVAGDGREWGYCEAESDVDATLDEIGRRGIDGPVALWGSSYSATLAVRVAARRSAEVAAVLAFSPAPGVGPMEACSAAAAWKAVEGTVLVVRPEKELEFPPVAEQTTRLESLGIPVVTAAGTHGSSILVESRGSEDADSAWREVSRFLAEHLPTADPGDPPGADSLPEAQTPGQVQTPGDER